jgi:hypothetical protein
MNIFKALKIVAVLATIAVSVGVNSGCSSMGEGSASASGGISSKPWLKLEPIRTVADLEQIRAGDEIAMVCGKCQAVEVHKVVNVDSKGRIKTDVATLEHQCPGCGSKLEADATKQTKVVHVCSKCGNTSALCSIVHKGE